MKLMDIDADTLSIPETEYDARVTLPASEFARIVRDLSQLGESVRIEVSKEGVRFAADGEAANGSVLLRQSDGAPTATGPIRPKSEERDIEAVDEDGDDDDDAAAAKPAAVKKEKDEDVEMEKDAEDEDGEEFKPKADDEDGEDEKDDEDADEDADEDGEDDSAGKKRKKSGSSSKPAKKAKTAAAKGKGKKKAADEDAAGVVIEMNQHVALTFSLKYLVNFSKSATLSPRVQLMMSNDVPLLVRTAISLRAFR